MASSGGPSSTAQAVATAPTAASQAASQAVAPTPAPQPPVMQPTSAPAADCLPAASAQPPAALRPPLHSRPPPAQRLRSIRRLLRWPPARSFQVPVVLNGGTMSLPSPCSSITIRQSFSCVNVSAGDFLSRDGQAAPTHPHRRARGQSHRRHLASAGNARRDRHRRSMRAHLPGQDLRASDLAITRASVVNSAQQQLPVPSAQTSIVVQVGELQRSIESQPAIPVLDAAPASAA